MGSDGLRHVQGRMDKASLLFIVYRNLVVIETSLGNMRQIITDDFRVTITDLQQWK